MNYFDQKLRPYVELNERGIVKRIKNLQENLVANGLEGKGLYQTLGAMQSLLEQEIPDLREEIAKRRKFVQVINILLIASGVLLIAFILLPSKFSAEIIANLQSKMDFVDSAMSILVGLVVSFFSVSLWAKQKSQDSVRKITDDVHQLVHRIDMYQLGKTPAQIVNKDGRSSLENLNCYVESIFVATQICGKMAALIYHYSDDDAVTQSARHLEIIAHSKADLIHKHWNIPRLSVER